MQSDTLKMSKTTDRKRQAALHHAAENKKPRDLENLSMHGVDVSAVALDGTMPIISAVMLGSFETMHYCLMQRGANLHHRDNLFDFSLVHVAALVPDKRKLQLLLDMGLNVNDYNANGVTALHLAAFVGNAQLVAELIVRGAKVNCCEKVWKYTPLHLAAMMDDYASLHGFIVKKKDPKFEGNENEVRSNLIIRCHEVSQRRGRVGVNYESVVEHLLKARATANCLDCCDRTPLHFATQVTGNRMTEMLLIFGAYADVRDNKGRYPVHNVIDRGDGETLSHLLWFGADFDNVISLFSFTSDWLDWKKVPCNFIDRYITQYIIGLTEVGFQRRAYRRADRYTSTFPEKAKSQIKKEAALLKHFYVEDNVSAYDVIHMNYRRRATFLNKLPADLGKKLRIFNSVIRGSCRQAFDKLRLMMVAIPAWDSITGMKWPDTCTDIIFSYLTNADIAALIVGEQKMRRCLKNQQRCN